MIEIAADFAAVGVAVRLGWLVAAVEGGPADADLAAEIETAMASLGDDGRPQDVPAVTATRQAYKALGKDPARYRPAAEALLRRVAQGKGLGSVGNVVDVNNLVSLETGFSIGTYDAARLAPPLVFRRGRAGESYAGIGRGPLNLEGLPVLADAQGPFGSPTSDSMRSRIDHGTARVLMVLIGFAPVPVEAAHLERARALLEAHCAARIEDGGFIDGGWNGGGWNGD